MDYLSNAKTITLAAGIECGIFLGWTMRGRYRNENDEGINSTVMGESGEIKMVLVVRSDLKMGKGKIDAQCSHAAVSAYKQIVMEKPQTFVQWEYCGQTKVGVKAPDEPALVGLLIKANELGLPVCIIRDAGRT
ncbi:peptidyl-tRNA hydrolase 2, mitochondrial-like [Pelodytes ibericus]